MNGKNSESSVPVKKAVSNVGNSLEKSERRLAEQLGEPLLMGPNGPTELEDLK
jgi:hypothetical protein